MTKQEALEIIKNENLKVNWFNSHPVEENEMVIEQKEEFHNVYGTDERAAILGIVETFNSLSEALENLIYRARL
ncbi:hypothetical protein GGG87_02750 [Streptococcus sp. zg-86]|uniref:Uncharacterized protein n=1 Tax=Streptococcus zhangguiae TaxID=2664091 RepID=A0ABW9R1X9_9STRE|nr:MULTISPECIES: Imm59 family immunity protein [unclassified Streptococcus]MTB63920.1 hypothetical protein [Streptococcus sp. zg-86]MTB90231.1 hypothetical protein [Streptococcus sp. zg-36]QTH46952.1 hypothetical protein J5M87_05105 [Streptococcus sp. zg-86]